MEVAVTNENWREERERLVALLQGYESGEITQFDEDDAGLLRRETTAERIANVKKRIAALDARLGDNDNA
jgi:hypothetical protein